MGKLEIAFAVGAVAVAGILGGVLYALYPNGFAPGYASENGAASTASSTYDGAYDGSGADQTTNTAPQDDSTASQAPADTLTGGGISSPQPSPDPGY